MANESAVLKKLIWHHYANGSLGMTKRDELLAMLAAEPAPEPQPRRRCVCIPNMVLTSDPLQYQCSNCGRSWPTDRDAPYCVDAPAREHLPPKEAAAAAIGILNNAERERYETREPDAPRRWIVEECAKDESDGSSSFATGGAYIREVRQLGPLTDDDERDERLAKVIEAIDRDYSGRETISKRLRVRIARAAIAEYAAILGGKEG